MSNEISTNTPSEITRKALVAAQSMTKQGLAALDNLTRSRERTALIRKIGLPYRPYFLRKPDRSALVNDISSFFSLPVPVVTSLQHDYEQIQNAKSYTQRFGALKTLSFEEAFVLYTIISVTRPATIVEIGTQYGKSTRRLLDAVASLGLQTRIVCFDILNEVQFFESHEAALILKDVTRSFQEDVLSAYQPELIFMDAHPYHLLDEVISKTIASPNPPILVIHDCGWGLCNPRMEIDPDRPELITSRTGHWERHVLAKLMNVENPLSRALDNYQNADLKLRIFNTQHGIAVLKRDTARSATSAL